ncbi:nitrogenase [Candidatus Moduliflexus flocculans]|uniref:Nitrogenase n=1 Tax=Candidatus Moduliflexus flocculans TaxID=1499966 RepID=A0A081BPX4_9BACT|nr:nitrogenase [Candidatus Moduliflexus flocculans]
MKTITDYKATKNACKLCSPLGASLAFKGVRGAVPYLHGSQGCSTYIRRYMISHFKEPIDIACSNFSEESVVFGGGANLKRGLGNIERQYAPELIGVATTCLSETIGDDVAMFLHEYRAAREEGNVTPIVHVSTPSYKGTHIDGFHGAINAIVSALAEGGEQGEHLNLLPGMVSPADLRYVKEIFEDMRIPLALLPDYSDTLDGGLWDEYHRMPEGGTPVETIRSMGRARATFEFGRILAQEDVRAGKTLQARHGVQCMNLGMPIGVNETDRFLLALEDVSARPTPEKYVKERARLLDAYADGHKYVSGKRAVIYGEEDFVVGLAAFLDEIGMIPVLCASGGKSGYLEDAIHEIIPDWEQKGIKALDKVDFVEIGDIASTLAPDMFIGNSKGYSITRKLDIPLVRVGFPIHDRIGGSRLLHLGYRGAQQLFDRIANAFLEYRQDGSEVGYSYM